MTRRWSRVLRSLSAPRFAAHDASLADNAPLDATPPDATPLGTSAERAASADGPPDDSEIALGRYLLYFVLPLWFVPGVADWYWHRKADIEHTSGTFESVTHALMMTSVGIPITAVLLLDVNALVIAMLMTGVVVHEGLTYWDVNYSRRLREVPTIEQHTHSFLEMLPLMATSAVICLRPKQFAAIFGRGDEPARWTLAPKRPPLTARYIATVLGAVALFIALPYAEEFVRCYRVDRTLLPHPRPGDEDTRAEHDTQ